MQGKLQLVLNYVGAALILAVWGLFAWFGKTSVEGYITSLGIALSAVAGTHAHSLIAKRFGVPDLSSPGTPSQAAGSSPSAIVPQAAGSQ